MGSAKVAKRFPEKHYWASQERQLFSYEKLVFVEKITSRRVPLSSTTPLVQHIRSTQKGHSFTTNKIPQFNTKNLSVPDQKTPQFDTPLAYKELFFVSFFCVELRGFWCWTEGFSVLNIWVIRWVEQILFFLSWLLELGSEMNAWNV